MESTNKKNSGRTFIFGLAFLFILFGCHTLEVQPEKSGVKIRAINERLIVKNVSNIPPIWCGSGLVYVATRRGGYLYDVKSGQTQPVDINYGFPMDCSPDGKWLVYLDKVNYGYDKKGGTSLVDAWRYEIATGEHQRFAVMDDDSPVFSPSGNRLFMGSKTSVDIEMPEPKWELFWSTEKRTNSYAWLNESVVIGGTIHPRKDNDRTVVEILEPERKTLYLKPPPGIEFASLWFADGQNRFYINADYERLLRCTLNIEDERMECEVLLEGTRDVHAVIAGSMFAEETLIFTRREEKCIRAKTFGEDEADCFITTEHKSGNYAVTSPDDKYLAFTVSWKNTSGRFIDDLYIVELLTD
ncbi:MAG: hypothetical protein V3V95_08645 [Thermodesulfobacteriota bacterium]